MKIIIGSDHAGFKYKEAMKKVIEDLGFTYEDLGTDSEQSCDYPAIGKKVTEKAVKNKTKGILICGSGVGMSVVANKVKGAIAANVHNEYTAIKSREHNDANILVLGERDTGLAEAKKIVKSWLTTNFSSEQRHKRRVKQIRAMDNC